MMRRPDAAHTRPHPGPSADASPLGGGPVRVTVIIKALNERARIGRAIESALAAVRDLGGEVVLADSGSTDGTVEEAARHPVRIVQLLDPRERSCGIGPELGWRHARGEYVYLMDGDMELHPGFLERALDFLAQHPEVAGVGGRVVERSLAGLEYRERAERAGSREPHRQPGPVDRLDGGGLYRRVAIQEAGYLSDRNLHSYEEFDLAVRLRVRGWRLWRLGLDAVAHEGHADPALRLLWRRWRTRYAWGCGEVLRASLGQPWRRLVLRELRELRLYAALWGWLGLLAALVAVVLGPGAAEPWRAGGRGSPASLAASAGALLALLPWAAMTWRKRSGARALYALAAWSVQAAGLLAGLLAPRRPPQSPIGARILREPGHAPRPGPTSPAHRKER